jgi:alkylation response protein AidB-like acyl-CoA dehydrogenase
VSKSTLKFERDNIGGTATTEQQFRRLVELARSAGRSGAPAIASGEVRQALAALQGYVLAQKYSSYRQMSMNLRDRNAGPIEAMGKLNGTLIGQRIAALAQDLLGADGLVMPPARQTAGEPRINAKWVNQIMGSMAVAIAGGTSNIQRNLIAERALGLPREGKAS